jgi:hypothetical protein
VNLTQVGKVQVGPQTKTTVSALNGGLSFQMASGSLCVASQSQNINVTTGGLRIALASAATIYDVIADAAGLKIAVFRGGIVAGGPGVATRTIYAGGAATATMAGRLSDVPITTIVGDFSKLKCPGPDVISQVVRTAPPSSTKGHGGGIGAILGGLLALGAIAVAATHRGGSTTGSGPFGPVVPNASTLNLKVGGSSGTINVSESGYSGTFTATAGACNGIASVSTSNGTSFTISPQAVGNCPIKFSDDHGQSARSLIFVNAGTQFISPQTMQFSGPGSSQSFTASDTSPATFTATSSDLAVATVTLVASTPNAATFSVASVTNGLATISVTDTLGGAGDVSVGVGQAPLAAQRIALGRQRQPMRSPHDIVTPPNLSQQRAGMPAPDSLVTSMASITFLRATTWQTLRISEIGYTGAIRVTSSDPNVASVRPASGLGEALTVLVTARSAGTANILVTDDHGAQVFVKVTVLQAEQIRVPQLPR